MVNMASGTTSRNMAAILQLIPSHAVMVYSAYLQCMFTVHLQCKNDCDALLKTQSARRSRLEQRNPKTSE